MTATFTAERPRLGIPDARDAFVPRPRQRAESVAQLSQRPSEDEQLHIHISTRDEYTVVYLIGELELMTYAATYDILAGLLNETDPRLILDLGGVTFADARGLSPVLDAPKLAARRGGWVRLARVPAGVRRILDILHLTEKLSIYETVAAAAADVQLSV